MSNPIPWTTLTGLRAFTPTPIIQPGLPANLEEGCFLYLKVWGQSPLTSLFGLKFFSRLYLKPEERRV